MTEAIWGVQESATATVKKTELEHITRTVRNRLRDLSTIMQTGEAVLRAIFREFDPMQTGNLTSAELQ